MEENDEFQDKIRRQEESLRKVMRENTTEYEVIDWDEKIRIHRKEIEREESEDEERRERAAKKEKSWELLRLCKKYILENGRTWKINKEDRQDELKKNIRLIKVAEKKEEMRKNLIQKKLTECWLQLPEKEKHKFRGEEERRKRLELKEVKENLWKWRTRQDKKNGSKRKDQKGRTEHMEDNIMRLEDIIERVKEEDRKRQLKKEEERKEREKRTTERKKRDEDRRLEEEKKNERIRTKKRMEERWEMIRWVSKYIEENQERWENEKRERDQQRKERLEDWDRAKRFERIRILREKEKKRENPTNEQQLFGEGWRWDLWREVENNKYEKGIDSKNKYHKQKDGNHGEKNEQKDGKLVKSWSELIRGKNGELELIQVEDKGVEKTTRKDKRKRRKRKETEMDPKIQKLVQNVQKSDPKVRKTDPKIRK